MLHARRYTTGTEEVESAGAVLVLWWKTEDSSLALSSSTGAASLHSWSVQHDTQIYNTMVNTAIYGHAN